MFERGHKQVAEEFNDAVDEVNTLLATASRTAEQNNRLNELKSNTVPALQAEYNTVRQSQLAMAGHRLDEGGVLVLGEEFFSKNEHGEFVRIR